MFRTNRSFIICATLLLLQNLPINCHLVLSKVNESCPCLPRNVCPRTFDTTPMDEIYLGVILSCAQDDYVRCCGVSIERVIGESKIKIGEESDSVAPEDTTTISPLINDNLELTSNSNDSNELNATAMPPMNTQQMKEILDIYSSAEMEEINPTYRTFIDMAPVMLVYAMSDKTNYRNPDIEWNAGGLSTEKTIEVENDIANSGTEKSVDIELNTVASDLLAPVTDKVDTTNVSTTEETIESKANEFPSLEVNVIEPKSLKLEAAEIIADEVSESSTTIAPEIFSTENVSGALHAESGTEIIPTDVVTEISPLSTEISPTEISATEISSTEISPTEISPTEISATEISATEISSTETATDILPTEAASEIFSISIASEDVTTENALENLSTDKFIENETIQNVSENDIFAEPETTTPNPIDNEISTESVPEAETATEKVEENVAATEKLNENETTENSFENMDAFEVTTITLSNGELTELKKSDLTTEPTTSTDTTESNVIATTIVNAEITTPELVSTSEITESNEHSNVTSIDSSNASKTIVPSSTPTAILPSSTPSFKERLEALRNRQAIKHPEYVPIANAKNGKSVKALLKMTPELNKMMDEEHENKIMSVYASLSTIIKQSTGKRPVFNRANTLEQLMANSIAMHRQTFGFHRSSLAKTSSNESTQVTTTTEKLESTTQIDKSKRKYVPASNFGKNRYKTTTTTTTTTTPPTVTTTSELPAESTSVRQRYYTIRRRLPTKSTTNESSTVKYVATTNAIPKSTQQLRNHENSEEASLEKRKKLFASRQRGGWAKHEKTTKSTTTTTTTEKPTKTPLLKRFQQSRFKSQAIV